MSWYTVISHPIFIDFIEVILYDSVYQYFLIHLDTEQLTDSHYNDWKKQSLVKGCFTSQQMTK
jgi:hypothetical protein